MRYSNLIRTFYSTKVLPGIKSSITKNILWLSFDKMFRIFIGLVVGIWLARYLGPEKWGKLNYIQAYLSTIIAVSALGMDGFLVKEILESPKRKNYVLGTSFILRSCVAVIATLIVYLFLTYIGLDKEGFTIYFLLLLTAVFTPFDIIDIEYQSKLKSKRTVVTKSIAYFLGAGAKLTLIILGKPLTYFAAVIGIESLLAYLFLVTQYQVSGSSIFNWRYNGKLAIDLMKKAWPFALSGIVIILYMRLDQIMLGNMIDEAEVGKFSAAVRITELFFFVPMAISSSFLPSLLNVKREKGYVEFKVHLERLINWMSLIALCIAIAVTLCSKFMIHLLYGPQYAETSGMLTIHVWALIAVFMGVASSQYLVIEGLQQYSFYRTAIGLAVNLVLNLLLIPSMKGYGAALATLISQFTAGCFANLLFPRTRILFMMQIRSLFFPITLFKKVKKIAYD